MEKELKNRFNGRPYKKLKISNTEESFNKFKYEFLINIRINFLSMLGMRGLLMCQNQCKYYLYEDERVWGGGRGF